MEIPLQDKQLCLKILLHRAWLNFQDSCLWKVIKAGPGRSPEGPVGLPQPWC